MYRTKWLERIFLPIVDNGQFPGIIERLAGTPARAAEVVRFLPVEFTGHRNGSKWSIREEIGHLADLEELWYGRLDDFQNGLGELRAADLSNSKTNLAGHNNSSMHEILENFRSQREKLVVRLLALTDEQLLITSIHPRLKTPMRIIDHAFFIAEHDDHHLARIREIISYNQKN